MAERKLTPRQQRFVEEYLVDLNATQAAIRAGYSPKTADPQGPRLLGDVRIAAAIEKAKAKRSKRTEITQDWVLNNIKEVVERCMADGDDFDPASALRGSELAGRHLGMWKDKVEVTGSFTQVLENLMGDQRIPSERPATRH